MKKQSINQSGFTLIELLVVIAILGILTTLVMVSINGVKSRAQDAKRVWDLRIVSTALESYYSDHGYYPYETDPGQENLCLKSWYDYNTTEWTALVANNWAALLQDLRAYNHNYLSKADLPGKMETDNSFLAKILPRVLAAGGSEKLQDPLYPKDYYTYGYMPSEGYDNYRLRAKLENLNFPALKGGLDGCFMYTDKCNDAPSGYSFEFGCAKSLGYFCLGPVGHYEAFDSGKPVIYLYPTEKQQISVKIWPKEIEKSEPLYNKGWQVTAYPNGTIINSSDGKNYPYLFWEGKSEVPNIERKTGFVISRDKVNEFLAEKLASQGLKDKESKDFIEFWAPRLKKKNYVYVYFMPQADYDQLIPLKIEPKPNTVIRIYMFFKSLDEPIKVEPQEFITPQRIGFTAVEWGGDRKELD